MCLSRGSLRSLCHCISEGISRLQPRRRGSLRSPKVGALAARNHALLAVHPLRSRHLFISRVDSLLLLFPPPLVRRDGCFGFVSFRSVGSGRVSPAHLSLPCSALPVCSIDRRGCPQSRQVHPLNQHKKLVSRTVASKNTRVARFTDVWRTKSGPSAPPEDASGLFHLWTLLSLFVCWCCVAVHSFDLCCFSSAAPLPAPCHCFTRRGAKDSRRVFVMNSSVSSPSSPAVSHRRPPLLTPCVPFSFVPHVLPCCFTSDGESTLHSFHGERDALCCFYCPFPHHVSPLRYFPLELFHPLAPPPSFSRSHSVQSSHSSTAALCSRTPQPLISIGLPARCAAPSATAHPSPPLLIAVSVNCV